MLRWLKKEPSKKKLKAALKEAYEEIDTMVQTNRECELLERAMAKKDNIMHKENVKIMFKDIKTVNNNILFH
jgi:arsenate reductase-like glutaredoxin family protein